MSLQEKIVSDYAGIPMDALEELCIVDFRALLRDAVIYNCSQTEEGEKHLERCWTLEQTKPDRLVLRKKLKG